MRTDETVNRPFDDHGRSLDTRPTPDRSYNRDRLTLTEKTWTAEKDRRPGQKGFYQDLFKTIRQGRPLVVTPESVRRQMRVLDECRKMAPV